MTIFFINLEAFVDISFFSPQSFWEIPQIRPQYFPEKLSQKSLHYQLLVENNGYI